MPRRRTPSSSSTATPIPATPPPAPPASPTLDIYEREDLFARAAALSPYFLDAVWSLRDLAIVRDIRGIGLLAGVEVHAVDGKPGLRGTELQKRLFRNGCHIKWTGDTAIVAPSFIAERAHIDEIVDCLRRTLAQ